VIRASGEAEVLGEPGTLLGVLPDLRITTASTALATGDVVVFYTDGLTERPDPYGRTEAEFAEYLAARAAGARCAEELADRIHRDNEEVGATTQRDDDVALVVLRVLERP
jgi:sigma-B regulation protein RsbU (phosphoserine phosphatase)